MVPSIKSYEKNIVELKDLNTVKLVINNVNAEALLYSGASISCL